jgi:hypothetical protein
MKVEIKLSNTQLLVLGVWSWAFILGMVLN